jgi:hypothetical protein
MFFFREGISMATKFIAQLLRFFKSRGYYEWNSIFLGMNCKRKT